MPNSDSESREAGRLSPLERLLGLFAEIRPGEGANTLLMFANIFLILTAYYVLKVVREGLMIGGVQLFGLEGGGPARGPEQSRPGGLSPLHFNKGLGLFEELGSGVRR